MRVVFSSESAKTQVGSGVAPGSERTDTQQHTELQYGVRGMIVDDSTIIVTDDTSQSTYGVTRRRMIKGGGWIRQRRVELSQKTLRHVGGRWSPASLEPR